MIIIKPEDLEGKGVIGQNNVPSNLTRLQKQQKFEEVERYHINIANQNAEEFNQFKENVLTKDNTTAYSPTAPYQPCTKEYADSLAQNAGNTASVFGRSGNVLAQEGDYTTDQITETENRMFVTVGHGATNFLNGEGAYISTQYPINSLNWGYIDADGMHANAMVEIEALPNKIYFLPAPEDYYDEVSVTTSTINVTFADAQEGYCAEYVLVVQTGNTILTLNLPTEAKWNNGAPIVFSANKIYIVSVLCLNGQYLAVGGEWQ